MRGTTAFELAHHFRVQAGEKAAQLFRLFGRKAAEEPGKVRLPPADDLLDDRTPGLEEFHAHDAAVVGCAHAAHVTAAFQPVHEVGYGAVREVHLGAEFADREVSGFFEPLQGDELRRRKGGFLKKLPSLLLQKGAHVPKVPLHFLGDRPSAFFFGAPAIRPFPFVLRKLSPCVPLVHSRSSPLGPATGLPYPTSLASIKPEGQNPCQGAPSPGMQPVPDGWYNKTHRCKAKGATHVGKRYAIVGGDAAGMSAATQIRRVDPQGEIVVWEKEGVISYAQCGLPYYVGGVVSAPERLLARTADEFRERYRIDVCLHHEVLAIDPRGKRVRILRRDTGEEIEEGYDVLLLATGSAAVLPPWGGIDLPGVFPLKTLADAERLVAWLSQRNPERAVIVGGGYIGLEAAEALVRHGLSVTVVDVAPQLIPSFDRPIAELVRQELERHGVEIRLEERVRGFSGDSAGVREVLLEGGSLAADLVLVAVGVRPVSELARAAGIELGPRGAVLVDEYLRTSVPDVYAAGDCATHFHRIKNAPDYIPLGTTANKQGRIAGANMAGAQIPFAGVLSTAIVKVFDLAIARTGLGEEECRTSGRTCETVAIQARPVSHYYPGAEDALTLRITFDPTTRALLGGQIAGRRGVDKRIDVLATALYAGLTIDELQALDLAYAPPFNGVWDPLQQASTVAQKKA